MDSNKKVYILQYEGNPDEGNFDYKGIGVFENRDDAKARMEAEYKAALIEYHTYEADIVEEDELMVIKKTEIGGDAARIVYANGYYETWFIEEFAVEGDAVPEKGEEVWVLQYATDTSYTIRGVDFGAVGIYGNEADAMSKMESLSEEKADEYSKKGIVITIWKDGPYISMDEDGEDFNQNWCVERHVVK